MAQLVESLTLKTGLVDSYNFNLAEDYNEVFNLRQEVDNSDAFITLLKGGDSIAQTAIRECKSVIIKNSGDVGAEVQIQTETWSDATPERITA